MDLQSGSHHPLLRPLSGLLTALLALGAGGPSTAEAQSLRPSRASLLRQGAAARQHDFTYLESRQDVLRFVRAGYLVPVRSNADCYLKGVSFPYARPEVKRFLQRLSHQYRSACGEELVVTSLTRPRRAQPSNASSRSVHPTGMAMDLRRSRSRRCRTWIEDTLSSLEARGVLEATRERRPPHYHVALFPDPYRRYLERRGVLAASTTSHRVAPGETLWEIARLYDTTVGRIQHLNGLSSSRILPGQRLEVPSFTHQVSPGETLWEIARRHGTTIRRIKQLNDLSTNRILPGQRLKLPATR